MRVNIYAEEMTDRVAIVTKKITVDDPDGRAVEKEFTGLRFYLELPVTLGSARYVDGSHAGFMTTTDGSGKLDAIKGPFEHYPGDDDSAAVTFWGKRDLRRLMRRVMSALNEHYAGSSLESALVTFAREELTAAGMFDKDSDYGGMIGEAAMEIVGMFAQQEHSGWSASVLAEVVNKLMRYEPLSPLTGEEKEWSKVADGLYQNRRCGRVFKNDQGTVWDVEGLIFRDPDGLVWGDGESKMPVEFPYTPTTVTVDRDADGNYDREAALAKWQAAAKEGHRL